MSTKNPRVMVVLDPLLFKWVKRQAATRGISLSLKLRDIVQEVYQSDEDRYWAAEGEKRLKKFKPGRGLSHEAFWKKAGA